MYAIRRPSAAVATSREDRRSPRSGREGLHQRWGRGSGSMPVARACALAICETAGSAAALIARCKNCRQTDRQARRGENDHALRVTVWGRVLRRNLKVNKRVLGGKGAKPCTTARFVRTQLTFWRNGGARTAGFIAANSVLRLAKTSSRLLRHLRPRWIRVSTKIFSAANTHHGKRPRDPDRRKTVPSTPLIGGLKSVPPLDPPSLVGRKRTPPGTPLGKH